MLNTYSELKKTLQNVFHSSSDKLFNRLKLAKPWETDADTKDELKISLFTAMVISGLVKGFFDFGFFPTEDGIVFGNELYINILFLDSCTVLHIVVTESRFSAVTVLDIHDPTYEQTVDGI